MIVVCEIEEEWQRKTLLDEFSGSGRDIELFEGTVDDVPGDVREQAAVLSVFIQSVCDAEELSDWPNLELISTRSTGYDHIDLDYCDQQGITVANVPTYGDNTVAEHTFALILSLSRNVNEAIQRTRRGEFTMGGIRGFDLRDKTIGIIGTGHIGVHVAKMARGFGMDILAYDVKHNDFLADLVGFEYVELPELVERSRIITLHCPLNEATHHLIDHEELDRTPDDVIMINTARGALINTDALLEALEEDRVAGAGLDVLEGEEMVLDESKLNEKDFSREKLQQLVQNNRLLQRDDVIFTPHMAYNSREALERILNTTIDNISTYSDRGEPVHPVSEP